MDFFGYDRVVARCSMLLGVRAHGSDQLEEALGFIGQVMKCFSKNMKVYHQTQCTTHTEVKWNDLSTSHMQSLIVNS